MAVCAEASHMSERESSADLHPLFSGTQAAIEDELSRAGYLKPGEHLAFTRGGGGSRSWLDGHSRN